MHSLALRAVGLVLLGVVLAPRVAGAERSLVLARGGTAAALIVYADDGPADPDGPDDEPAAPAIVLAGYLHRITGAEFPVEKESEYLAGGGKADRPLVVVGQGKLSDALGVNFDGVGRGGIVIRTAGSALVLMGRGEDVRPGGTSHAVFQFLELLGCRYLWPGELGKVIPHRPDLEVGPLAVAFTPPIGQRGVRFSTRGPNVNNFALGLRRLGLSREEFENALNAAYDASAPDAWYNWQRLGGNLGVVGGHAGYGLKGGWKQFGRSHPEWFALQPNGSRDQSAFGDRWRLCVSNPDLIAHVADDIIAEVRRNPRHRAFSLAPNDGGLAQHCGCEECRKLDPPGTTSKSDRHVHYWNAVAARVNRVFPDVVFTIDAYADYSDPPVREKLSPNLVVRYVPSDAGGWKGWQAAGARRIFWRPNNLYSGYREGALWVTAGFNARTLRYLQQNGMFATDMSSLYHNWAGQGLNYYVCARLDWDPRLTYDEELADFCRAGFGAGAAAMERYYRRAEEFRSPFGLKRVPTEPECKWTPEGIEELRGCIRAAQAATHDDPAIAARLAFISAGMEYTALTARMFRLSLAPDVHPDPDLLRRRWERMRGLFAAYPLAVNVAVAAGYDEPLVKAFDPRRLAAERLAGAGERKPEWMFEDQTLYKLPHPR